MMVLPNFIKALTFCLCFGGRSMAQQPKTDLIYMGEGLFLYKNVNDSVNMTCKTRNTNFGAKLGWHFENDHLRRIIDTSGSRFHENSQWNYDELGDDVMCILLNNIHSLILFISESSLTINPLQPQDTGIFSCCVIEHYEYEVDELLCSSLDADITVLGTYMAIR